MAHHRRRLETRLEIRKLSFKNMGTLSPYPWDLTQYGIHGRFGSDRETKCLGMGGTDSARSRHGCN